MIGMLGSRHAVSRAGRNRTPCSATYWWCLISAVSATIAPTSLAWAQAEYSGALSQIGAAVVRIHTPAEVESHPPFGPQWFSETGVLVSPEGYVVSNAEIARKSEGIVAIFADGRRFAGTLVGSDHFSNIAVFKIDGADQDPPAHGNAEELQVGETVYAVSATQDGTRRLVLARVRDAARLMRSGSFPIGPYLEIGLDEEVPFGGAVFNDRGKLVGFVVIRSGPPQKTRGVLATPINDVTRIADELREFGKVRRSRIGLAVQRVPGDVATARGLTEPTGALIATVAKGSPAERAGLLADDIILRLDATVIRNPDEYMIAMGRIRAGTQIRLEILRADRKRNVSLVSGEVVSGPPVGQPDAEERKVVRPE